MTPIRVEQYLRRMAEKLSGTQLPNEEGGFDMSEDDITEISTRVDDFDYSNEDDVEDYFTIAFYKHPDGRHFRWIESSGMNSKFHGSHGFDQWLTNDQTANWKDA